MKYMVILNILLASKYTPFIDKTQLSCNVYRVFKFDIKFVFILYLYDGFTCVKEKFTKIDWNVDTIFTRTITFDSTVIVTTSRVDT